jgi:hypothetical protein
MTMLQKYVIERDVPGAGKLNAEELRNMTAASNKVLNDLGPEIQWIQSYVTDDKLYCVYLASGEDIVLEHARCGGFPANKVSQVGTVIDPTTEFPSA